MKINDDQILKKMYSSRDVEELGKFEKKDQLHTGVNYIDSDFGFPTGYYIIVGNQGVGKSWFALWLARVFYRHDLVKSVYFTLEMPEHMVRKRILQQWSDLTKTEIESGSNTKDALSLLKSDVIVVDEFYSQQTNFRTPNSFESWVDEYYRLGYRCFLIDHFHELGGASVNESNQKTVELWGSVFQKICKKYKDIWLIVFAQPNAEGFNKKILNRNSLRGSKSLIDKADYVLTLNRDFIVDEETGAMIAGDNNKILIYLDKTRYTEKPNIIFKIMFLPTGNFRSGLDSL